jgi:hypothetical protein
MSQRTQSTRPGLQDPEWYRSMRDNDPVWRDPESGTWNVFRYQDVAAITCTPGKSLHEVFLKSVLEQEEARCPHLEA